MFGILQFYTMVPYSPNPYISHHAVTTVDILVYPVLQHAVMKFIDGEASVFETNFPQSSIDSGR